MKTHFRTVVPILALGSLAVPILNLPAAAADLPWTYDTSKRVEPEPSAQTSPACGLDAKAQDAAVGVGTWFSSVFCDHEISSGSDLTTLPIGFLLFFR